MRPNSDLSQLSAALRSRIVRLNYLYALRTPQDTADLDRLTAYCTIELANSWTQFMRSFYLSCAGNARQRSGARVRHSGAFPKGYVDALAQSALIFGIKVKGP